MKRERFPFRPTNERVLPTLKRLAAAENTSANDMLETLLIEAFRARNVKPL